MPLFLLIRSRFPYRKAICLLAWGFAGLLFQCVAESETNAPFEFQSPQQPTNLAALPTAHAPEPATDKTTNHPAELPARNVSPHESEDTNLAISLLTDQVQRHSMEMPPSPNILSENSTNGPQQEKVFELKLELAHNSRKNMDYGQAEKCLLFILEGKAPEHLKGAALLEYASMSVEQKQLARAQQIYAQWVRKFPDHPDLPEVILRQGLIYRDMGAPNLALTKFFSVMSTALSLKMDRMEYYRKLVLRAQTEIADTYFLQASYEEAANKYALLLKLGNPDLNRGAVLFKLIKALACLQRHSEVIGKAQTFLHDFPDSAEQPEARFMLASSLKKLGRDSESLQQVMLLLQSQQRTALSSPEKWRYWQQRTGNDIANQLYQQGDYLNSLTVYAKLAELDNSPSWQLPVWYQIGLVYEQLKQPGKATEYFKQIVAQEKNISTGKQNPNLSTVIDMARWRENRLAWQMKAEQVERDFTPSSQEEKKSDALPQ